MNLLLIAYRNVRKNQSFYALYFFSVVFVLAVFFCFVSFSVNSVMMEKISQDGRVEMMTKVIAVFLMCFVIFYMSYSNNFFLKRRMKELGVYTILGYRKSAILKLLTIENALICCLAFLVGTILGAAAHKIIVAIIVHLLDLNINQSIIPFFNGRAIIYSASFVAAVVIALNIANRLLLHKLSLLKLIQLEKESEKKRKSNMLPAVLGLLMTVLGDILAIDSIRQRKSVWFTIGISPVALFTITLVTLGTALFIYSFLPYVMQTFQGRKSILYQPITIIFIPKFIHRIRTNAKTFTMLSLLSAATLSLFGVLSLSIYYPIAAVARIVPSAIEFREESPEQSQQTIRSLNNKIGKDSYNITETNIIKVTASSGHLPVEYSLSKRKGRQPGFEVISLSDYKGLMEQQSKKSNYKYLGDYECVLVKYRSDPQKTDIGSKYQLILPSRQTIKISVKDTTLKNPIGFSNSIGTIIVSDMVYHRLADTSLPLIKVISINGNGFRSKKYAYMAVYPILKENPYFACAYARTYEIKYTSSSTFLLLGFLTMLFFIASGSILYFQNISAVTYDKSDYEILGKIGYNQQVIKAVIRKQLSAFYIIPFVLGLTHSICAILSYKYLLMDDILGQISQIFLPVLLSLSISGSIHIIYYQITKYSCYRIALTASINSENGNHTIVS